MQPTTKHQTLNRTFARRVSKKLSDYKKGLLENQLPKYLYKKDALQKSQYKKVFLEVGFGMGEHFINQAKTNPGSLFIGAEVFLNGVAKVLKEAGDLGLENYLIWPDDLDLLFDKIPDKSLDGIYVLFPDPWHKNRYMKKRLFNQQRLDMFKNKLKLGAFVAFASDIEDYFADAKELLEADPEFKILNEDPLLPHENYIQTKYHSKAIKEGRRAQFVSGVYLS